MLTRTEARRCLRILLVDSARDLFKYKSFFLLVFLLMLVDRLLKKYVHVDRSIVHFSKLKQLTRASATYVFDRLPHDLWLLLTDYRTFLILAVLFFLKQLISLWPSSDMRRMHRYERSAFGLIGSLAAIRWEQVVWDAVAVGSLCLLYAAWAGAGFLIAWFLWQATHAMVLLPLLLVQVALFSPLAMAGFSFSSKLAIISRGSFSQKLALYFKLFFSKHVLGPSWIFFALRILIEAVFVVILPLAVLLFVDVFWLRISLATLVATPVYSYLKMVSFKFFLEVYGAFPPVRQEFSRYFEDTDSKTTPQTSSEIGL